MFVYLWSLRSVDLIGEAEYLRKKDHLERRKVFFQSKHGLGLSDETIDDMFIADLEKSAAEAVAKTVGGTYGGGTAGTDAQAPGTVPGGPFMGGMIESTGKVLSIAELKKITEANVLQKKLLLQQKLQNQASMNPHAHSHNLNNSNTTNASTNIKGKREPPKRFLSWKDKRRKMRLQEKLMNRTIIKDVTIPEDGLLLKDLATKLSMKVSDLKNRLEGLGENCTFHVDEVTDDTADSTTQVEENNNESPTAAASNTIITSNNSQYSKKTSKALSTTAMNAIIEEKLKNKHIDADVAELVVLELGLNVIKIEVKRDDQVTNSSSNNKTKRDNKLRAVESATTGNVVLEPRAPIVCIMGHVDVSLIIIEMIILIIII